MEIWGEMLYRSSTKTLKTRALELRDEINLNSKRKLKMELERILAEIEYQEGRLQYANRPYSFPKARLPIPGAKPIEHDFNCDCGCWLKIFKE